MATKNTAPVAAKDITPEKIAEWKKAFGKIYVATTEDGKMCYLRRPTREIISMAAVLGGVDNLKQKEILIRNCCLGGDPEIQTEDKYFLGLSSQVEAIIEVAQVELKEV